MHIKSATAIHTHRSAATEHLILIKVLRREMLHALWLRWGPSWPSVGGRLVCFPVSPNHSPSLFLSISLSDFRGLIYDFVWVVNNDSYKWKILLIVLWAACSTPEVIDGRVLWAQVSHSAGSISPLREPSLLRILLPMSLQHPSHSIVFIP